MELLTYKGVRREYTYYLGKNGERVRHGEYKDYHFNGRPWEHIFFYHGECHGEGKVWDQTGSLQSHCFYINDRLLPYVEMTKQEKLLFQIQHPGFQFLPPDDV